MTQSLQLCNARILVVGDIMLDVYKYGIATRISPEAPVPVVQISKEDVSAGGAANVAVNLCKLGCKTELIGYIGNDYTGNQLRIELSRNGVKHDRLIKSIASTISKIRVLADRQHVIRYDNDSTINTPTHRDKCESVLIELLTVLGREQSFDVVVVSDYAKGTITANIMDTIKSSFTCPIICDMKPINRELFHDVFCLTPNLIEAKQLVDMENHQTLLDVAVAIKKKFHLDIVVITLSEDGIFFLDRDGQSHMFPAYVSVNRDNPGRRLDVTGAGDTVLSTLAACIAVKYDLLEAVKLSNLAAGIVVGKTGTATCHIEELQNAYLQL